MYYIHLQSFFCVHMYMYMCLGVYLHVNGHIGPKISVRGGSFSTILQIFIYLCVHMCCAMQVKVRGQSAGVSFLSTMWVQVTLVV